VLPSRAGAPHPHREYAPTPPRSSSRSGPFAPPVSPDRATCGRDRCAVRIYSPVAGFGSASEGSLPRSDWSGRGCFLLKINSARENSARVSANMRQHFRICCGHAGRLPLSAPSLRGSDESYAGGSRANCAATPPGSAGRRYRPTMRAFRANGEKGT
jgi:hypothetical protein